DVFRNGRRPGPSDSALQLCRPGLKFRRPPQREKRFSSFNSPAKATRSLAMRVLLAFDKFKDSLTALAACDLAANALRARHPDWMLDLCPLADGGEGFCEILTAAAGGEIKPISVTG